jgi:hypothetical protein
MEWIVIAVVGLVILTSVLYGLLKSKPKAHHGQTTQTTGARTSQRPAPIGKPSPARLSAAEVLARVRGLQGENAQWQEIWSRLNPGGDPLVQQLLLDLRNDGLQFAPSDGMRRIERASAGLATVPGADALNVLSQVLGQTDLLDKFK